MTNKPRPVSPWTINLFFIIGIISSISFRVIILFQNIEPSWVRPTWYAGVIGYFLFFMYRYYISEKRRKAIKEYGLIEKISEGKTLTPEEIEVSAYIMKSIVKSRENINYFFIFILSFIVIAIDIAMTLSR